MALESQKELSEWDKGRIEGRSGSMSDREIGHELHIPHQTVSSFLMCLKTQHSSENLPRPGHPRITTKAQDRQIIAASEANTHVPFAALQNIVNIPASTTTIRRRLHDDLIRKWCAVKRALLKKEYAEKRLKWAMLRNMHLRRVQIRASRRAVLFTRITITNLVIVTRNSSTPKVVNIQQVMSPGQRKPPWWIQSIRDRKSVV